MSRGKCYGKGEEPQAQFGSALNNSRKITQAKSGCESTKCAHLYQMENMNCVNKCLSSDCYEQVYKDRPLEDGEINTLLERQFKSCHRKELTTSRRNLNREKEKMKAAV